MEYPNLKSQDLAYETGVHIGDGSMSIDNSGYVISFWGDSRTDRKYFSSILLPLLKNLYGAEPEVRKRKNQNTIYLRIYSKRLVEFKHMVLELPIGKKTELQSLPSIFSYNPLVLSLISGIFDADGTVKIVKRRKGIYPRLRITLKNKELIFQIKEILLKKGITSTVSHDKRYDYRINKCKDTWDLDINGFSNLSKFTKNFHIRNPKHLEKIRTLIMSKL